VLHLGSMDLKDYIRETGRNARTPAGKIAQITKSSGAEAPPPNARPIREKPSSGVYETLRKLLPEAEKRGLKLGIENRQALRGNSAGKRLRVFFREFDSPIRGFIGTTPATRKSRKNLGFLHHAQHLESLDRAAWPDFTFTDVQFPAADHAPARGSGTLTAPRSSHSLKPDHIKVFELSPSLPVEAVKRGIAHVKTTWGNE